MPAESVPSSPASSLPPLSAINTRLPQSPRPPSSLLSPVSVRSSPSRSPSRRPPFDLRFLQDPSLYHELPTQDIPKPFFDSDHQPPPDAPISDLLAPGHFRRAAIACLGQLLRARPLEPEDLLQLLYTRLACLILIARPDLAAQEALPLTDFLARNSPGARELLPLISWELRILLVRLQSIGAGDGGRRGIMALYALAAEVRANLKQAQEKQMKTEVEVMMGRLQDLGLRVADALVEMNEQEPAARHLKTLEHATEEQLAWRQALLWIRLGDIEGAHKCLDGLKSAEQKEVLSAMIAVANGEYEAAVSAWRSLCKQYPENEMVAQNLAVCLLYTGHIIEVHPIKPAFFKAFAHTTLGSRTPPRSSRHQSRLSWAALQFEHPL